MVHELLIAVASLVTERSLQGMQAPSLWSGRELPTPPMVGESSWTGVELVPLHWTIGEVLKVFIVIFFPHYFVDFGHPW